MWPLVHTGLSIEGVYMVNWSQIDEFGTCKSDNDYKDVMDVCRHIGIPCRRAEFVQDYWNEVFRWVWSKLNCDIILEVIHNCC